MRAPLDVLITVDTEVWPRYPGGTRWTGSGLRGHLDRDIYGLTGGGEYGLPYQMDVLEAHGLKGVFLVESLFACVTGIEPLAEIVGMIAGRGHEVQLHMHPEWLAWMPEPMLPGRRGRHLREFTEDEQLILLEKGLENLGRAGATGVRAFRAGNYGADFATLRALARAGIEFDTSYNACYLGGACGLGLGEPLRQPRMLEGVCEVPISYFSDYPGHRRHAQICACSWWEMRRALEGAWGAGWGTFVIVSHSFELLRRDRHAVPRGADGIVIGRFEKLCRYLGENRGKYRSAGFGELDAGGLVSRGGDVKGVRTGLLPTALRCAEQAVRRLNRPGDGASVADPACAVSV